MKKIFTSVFTFILFTTVVHAESTMIRVIESWLGENLDSVISKWGYPTQEKNIADKHLYIWTIDYGTRLNNKTQISEKVYCERVLEVNKENKIIAGEWSGNNCPLIYATAANWVNPQNNYWKDKKETKEYRKLQLNY